MNQKLKTATKIILYYSPRVVKEKLSSIAAKREMEHALAVSRRTHVESDEVKRVLDCFTFDSDIMLHSSLINIGKIKGGAKYVTNTILEYVNIDAHTLLTSALPYRGSFASWLSEDRVFDVRSAPIAMGAINERIAKLDGAIRSIHPTHSVVAIGPRAKEYVGEHQFGLTPFSEHSPYYKLIANRAKVLLFGTKLNNMTLVHAIEDLLRDVHPRPVYEKREYDIRCIDYDGNELVVHTPVHSRYQGMFRDGMRIHDTLIEHGVMKSVPIGESEVSMVDCFGYAMTYLDCLAGGTSIYGKHKVTTQLLDKIEEVKFKLQQVSG